MKTQQQGFTLVELIVVIVILGILAATALPRFVNLQTDAKAASMKGLAGGLRGAVELVRARWLVTGNAAATTVTMADTTVVTVGTAGAAAGVPVATALGIELAIGSMSGYSVAHGVPAAGSSTFTPATGPAGCTVIYTGATGAIDDAGAVAATC